MSDIRGAPAAAWFREIHAASLDEALDQFEVDRVMIATAGLRRCSR